MSFKRFEYKTPNTVFCVGSGPSARGFDFDILKQKQESEGIFIIVVNRVMDKLRFADIAVTCDTSILKNYFRAVPFNGLKVAAMYSDFGESKAFQVLTRNEKFDSRIHFIIRKDLQGLSYQREHIHGLANSGFGALGLAFHMIRDSKKENGSIKRIVLIGYDFKNHQDYWYNNTKLQNKDFPHYDRQMEQFYAADQQCKQLGIQVINCSPGSKLPFEIKSLSQVKYL